MWDWLVWHRAPVNGVGGVHVAVGVDAGGAVLLRLIHGDDKGQGVVFYLDEAAGLLRDFLRLRHHGGHPLSHKPHLAAEELFLVGHRLPGAPPAPVVPLVGRVFTGIHSPDAGQRLRPGGVDGANHAVGNDGMLQLDIQHSRSLHISAIVKTTGHLAVSLVVRQFLSDYMKVFQIYHPFAVNPWWAKRQRTVARSVVCMCFQLIDYQYKRRKSKGGR